MRQKFLARTKPRPLVAVLYRKTLDTNRENSSAPRPTVTALLENALARDICCTRMGRMCALLASMRARFPALFAQEWNESAWAQRMRLDPVAELLDTVN